MSGCGLTVLIGVFQQLSGANIPYSVYIGVLILFVFVACFLAWIDARMEMYRLSLDLSNKEQELLDKGQTTSNKERTISELRQELFEVKEQRTPQLEAKITEQSIAEIVENGTKQSAVTLKIVVSNIGAMPSAAINWAPFVFVAGYNPRQCHIFHFENELTLGYDGGVNDVIKSQDMIYEKTVNPIQVGAIVVGYLHFRTSFSSNEIRAPDSDIKVLFTDTKGKVCEALFEKNKSTPLTAPAYTPGVQTRRIIKTRQKNSRKKHK